MNRAQEARKLPTRVETRNCILRRGEIEVMEESLGPLEDVAAATGPADLRVKIKYDPRSNEYHVRTTLHLPEAHPFVGEHGDLVLPAYERCLRKLAHKTRAWRLPTEAREAALKRTQPATPRSLPSLLRLQQAFDLQDYESFRQELRQFDESIRWRVDRWIRRYASHEAAHTADLPMEELVEEVLLTAFESCESRPEAMRIGDWLDSLIAPSMRSFLEHPDEDQEAIGYARTLQEFRDDPRSLASGVFGYNRIDGHPINKPR